MLELEIRDILGKERRWSPRHWEQWSVTLVPKSDKGKAKALRKRQLMM
jgi:hypothetical protein